MHNLDVFHGGGEQPQWEPTCSEKFIDADLEMIGNSYIFDNVISGSGCRELIEQFNHQEVYPVGIDGYSNTLENVGSFRAMGWAPTLAENISQMFSERFRRGKGIPNVWDSDGRNLYAENRQTLEPPFNDGEAMYTRLGSTPWMRFMRYQNGGMHVPHYDTSYHCPEESYRTLFSWVLYLNDVPEEQGGGFQFVDDGKIEHIKDRPSEDQADWHRMADPEEIISTIQPKQARLIVFPHWVCHQVQAFLSADNCKERYLIRGDLAYGIS
jgi:hypothetical protein